MCRPSHSIPSHAHWPCHGPRPARPNSSQTTVWRGAHRIDVRLRVQTTSATRGRRGSSLRSASAFSVRSTTAGSGQAGRPRMAVQRLDWIGSHGCRHVGHRRATLPSRIHRTLLSQLRSTSAGAPDGGAAGHCSRRPSKPAKHAAWRTCGVRHPSHCTVAVPASGSWQTVQVESRSGSDALAGSCAGGATGVAGASLGGAASASVVGASAAASCAWAAGGAASGLLPVATSPGASGAGGPGSSSRGSATRGAAGAVRGGGGERPAEAGVPGRESRGVGGVACVSPATGESPQSKLPSSLGGGVARRA